MTNEPEASAVEKEQYVHGQTPLDLDGATVKEGAPQKPQVNFQSKVHYLDGSHELIAHLEPPKVIAGGLLQLLQEDQIIVLNLSHTKKIITKVIQIQPTNGHSRIIT